MINGSRTPIVLQFPKKKATTLGLSFLMAESHVSPPGTKCPALHRIRIGCSLNCLTNRQPSFLMNPANWKAQQRFLDFFFSCLLLTPGRLRRYFCRLASSNAGLAFSRLRYISPGSTAIHSEDAVKKIVFSLVVIEDLLEEMLQPNPCSTANRETKVQLEERSWSRCMQTC